MLIRIELHDENYNIEFYLRGESGPSSTGSGPYHNFVESIQTLDDWYATFDCPFEVEDFRSMKDQDPITLAKAIMAERQAKKELAIAKTQDALQLIDVANTYGMSRIEVIRHLRDRFGHSIGASMELAQALVKRT